MPTYTEGVFRVVHVHRLCRGDEAIDEDAVVVLDDVGDGRVDFLPRLRFAREGKDEANASLLQNRANGLGRPMATRNPSGTFVRVVLRRCIEVHRIHRMFLRRKYIREELR